MPYWNPYWQEDLFLLYLSLTITIINQVSHIIQTISIQIIKHCYKNPYPFPYVAHKFPFDFGYLN